MKRTILAIAILSLTVVALANRQLSIAHGYAMSAARLCSDAAQRPKGDELTEEFPALPVDRDGPREYRKHKRRCSHQCVGPKRGESRCRKAGISARAPQRSDH